MKQGIGEFCKIKHYINDKVIGFSGTNAVDFLSKVYDNADEKLKLKRKYDLYLAQLDMCKPIPKCYFVKTNIMLYLLQKEVVQTKDMIYG